MSNYPCYESPLYTRLWIAHKPLIDMGIQSPCRRHDSPITQSLMLHAISEKCAIMIQPQRERNDGQRESPGLSRLIDNNGWTEYESEESLCLHTIRIRILIEDLPTGPLTFRQAGSGKTDDSGHEIRHFISYSAAKMIIYFGAPIVKNNKSCNL